MTRMSVLKDNKVKKGDILRCVVCFNRGGEIGVLESCIRSWIRRRIRLLIFQGIYLFVLRS